MENKKLPNLEFYIPRENCIPDSVREQIREMEQRSKRICDERSRIENEKRKQLKDIAENSSNFTKLLAENNELLKKQNEMLSNKLSFINKTLDNLFNLQEVNDDEMKELMLQANEIAKNIEINMLKNGKFNIKDFALNTSTTALFLGIEVFLHSKGLI